MARRRAQLPLTMEVFTSVESMRRWAINDRDEGHTIGFVPTMGALHAGHETLIRESVRHNDSTVLSIFVNPTQFNQTSDFAAYPRTWELDLEIARRNGVDVVFAPSVVDMYPLGFDTRVVPGRIASVLEGIHRPGHFDGVATVVLKLFNAVPADRAYFGLKDFQQVAVVRAMVRDFGVPIDIVAVPTVREADGLAMSSRNVRLSAEDRRAASVIHRALVAAFEAHDRGEHNADVLRSLMVDTMGADPRCRVEYAEIADVTTLQPLDIVTTSCVALVAAWFGDVRLIDNIELPA